MLYIWPLFVFFSWPLWCSDIVSAVSTLRQLWIAPASLWQSKKPASPASKRKQADAKSYRRPKSFMLEAVESFFQRKCYLLLYALGHLALSLLIVRYSTVVHPFTLADNRHYMFYIFRYTVLQPGRTRYYLIVVYNICSLMCWWILLGCNGKTYSFDMPGCTSQTNSAMQMDHINTPFAGSDMRQLVQRAKEERQPADRPKKTESDVLGALDAASSTSTFAVSTSTWLLWMAATALSLMTAPLVEPRYFILPWVFWRLMVPAWPAHDCLQQANPDSKLDRLPGAAALFGFGKKVDLRLFLETMWFLAVNAGTMAMFLCKPFYWKAADGTLMDEGRVQRFMW